MYPTHPLETADDGRGEAAKGPLLPAPMLVLCLPVVALCGLLYVQRHLGMAMGGLGFAVLLGITVAETLALFVWCVWRAERPWGSFGRWVGFQLVVLTFLFLCLFPLVPPPSPKAHRCGMVGLLFVGFLMMVPVYLVFSTLLFGGLLKTKEVGVSMVRRWHYVGVAGEGAHGGSLSLPQPLPVQGALSRSELGSGGLSFPREAREAEGSCSELSEPRHGEGGAEGQQRRQ